jgi:hypothetical protein
MTDPSPLPPGAPPPPPERYTEPEATKSAAVRIFVGFPIGLVAGFATGLLPLWFLAVRGERIAWSQFWIPLALAAAIGAVLVRRTWRRGWRGVPIGFGIGAAIGGSLCLLIWIDCAS